MSYMRITAMAVLVSISSVTNVNAMSVSPVKVTLKNTGDSEVIRLVNPRNVATTVRIQPYLWKNSASPDDLRPTEDILAVPPIFEIGPGDEQVIRVALRKPNDSRREQTYRMLISEVPSEVDDTAGVQVNFRVNMPIFVAPTGARPEPQWRLEPDPDGVAELVLNNDGSAHLQVTDLSLTKSSDDQAIFNTKSAGYIFAGEKRSWLLDVEASDLKGPLNLTAETNRGPIEAVVTLPEG